MQVLKIQIRVRIGGNARTESASMKLQRRKTLVRKTQVPGNTVCYLVERTDSKDTTLRQIGQ